jgi:hypothetical protein
MSLNDFLDGNYKAFVKVFYFILVDILTDLFYDLFIVKELSNRGTAVNGF